MSIITRFAPSPTGFLHIGGARTALFNYLYTQKMKGRFLLRIENTDQIRENKDAAQAIIDGLSWLGLSWDGDIVWQRDNLSTHQKIAQTLVNTGKAYYCYCLAETEQKDCPCSQLLNPPSNAPQPCIKMKVNHHGSIVLNDLVVGKVEFQLSEIDDFVILRSNKTPVYLLASVIDDINMNITHIIRGDDHLTNTFRHIIIYQALNQKLPLYAHIPLIYSENGDKMSKRHGAIGVHEYQKLGFLPAAINSYLMNLGWSTNNKLMSLNEASEIFDIQNINKSPSRFDLNKLKSINFDYIKNSTDLDLYHELIRFIDKYYPLNYENTMTNYQSYLQQLMPFLKVRCSTLVEILEASDFIIKRNLVIDPNLLNNINISLLNEQLDIIQNLVNFDRSSILSAIKEHGTNHSLKLGDAVNSLRIALTGAEVSAASVFDIMAILGKEISINRIKKALTKE